MSDRLIETEVKYAIATEEDFLKVLLWAGKVEDERTLLNCYLDGEGGELSRLGWVARLRISPHEAWLTLKKRIRGDREGLFESVEIEGYLKRGEALSLLKKAFRSPKWVIKKGELLLDPIREAPEEVKDTLRAHDLVVTTWSLTRRRVFRRRGLELVLDETQFPDGHRDFEIEIEDKDVGASKALIETLSSEAKVPLFPQTMTKHGRALRHRGEKVPKIPGTPFFLSVPSWLVSAFLAFAFYLAFLPPVPAWLDAPEFIAASFKLGHAHPPGHPVAMVLIKAFLLLPIGDAPFRANLLGALLSSIGAGLVSLLTERAVLQASGNRGVAWLSGLFGAQMYGLSLSGVIQALSIEVYSLNMVMVLGAILFGLGSRGDYRALALASITFGLGLANHHYLTLLSLPAVVASSLTPKNLTKKAFLLALSLCLTVTIAVNAYLFVRGLANPWPGWAKTSNLEDLLWVVSARVFSASLGGFEEAHSSFLENLLKAAGLLASSSSPLHLVVALGGLYLMFRLRCLRLVLVLLLFGTASVMSKAVMGILDPSNPDDHGYFLGAVASLSVLSAFFAATLISYGTALRGPLLRLPGFSLLLVLTFLSGLSGLREAKARLMSRDSVEIVKFILDEEPQRAILFVSHYPVFFQVMYAQEVEAARPDMTVVQSSFYKKAKGGRFYIEHLLRRDRDLSSLCKAFLEKGLLDGRLLVDLAKKRPLRAEPEGWVLDFIRSRPNVKILFQGWTVGIGETYPLRPINVSEYLGFLRALLPGWPMLEVETRRVVLRHLYEMARVLAALGDILGGREMVTAALEIAPIDRDLLALEAQLRYGGVEGHKSGASENVK